MAEDIWLIDTAPSERFPVLTRLNASDVLPDPITPLGASLAWIPYILPGWADGYVTLGAFAPGELTDESAVGGFQFGHLYVNQSSVRVVGVRAGIGWQAIDAAFFRVDSPPHDEHPDDVDETMSAKMAARTQWTLTTTTFPEIEEERQMAERVRAFRPDLASLSPLALVAYARSLMPLERLTWRSEVMASNLSATGPAVISQLIGDADPSLVVQVIGQAGDVDSAAPSFALWDLSRSVRADSALTAEFDRGTSGLLERLHAEHPGFASQFLGFLHDFGYRGPSEWDLGAASWETHPELALALIDRLRQLEDAASPAARQAEMTNGSEEAMQKALALLGDNDEAKQTLHMAIASARRFGSWRERAKSNCIKVLHEARMALTELGRRLHAEGHLDDPQHLFMATDAELGVLMHDAGSLRDTLAKRHGQWRNLFDLEIPVFVDGRQPIIPLSQLPQKAHREVEPVKPGEVLQGAPAAGGVVRGVARVVLDTASIAEFQPGEILVAPQTDPSWTPLFMVAAGVVVDVGAMNSHAMIVSRELGIPCAASVPEATRRIPTGATIEVDGSTGAVTVLEL